MQTTTLKTCNNTEQRESRNVADTFFTVLVHYCPLAAIKMIGKRLQNRQELKRVFQYINLR